MNPKLLTEQHEITKRFQGSPRTHQTNDPTIGYILKF